MASQGIWARWARDITDEAARRSPAAQPAAKGDDAITRANFYREFRQVDDAAPALASAPSRSGTACGMSIDFADAQDAARTRCAMPGYFRACRRRLLR